MRVVFVRHGEKRSNEADPELTSRGRRMAWETGEWLATQALRPDLVITTATRRTRQTAEELLLGGPRPAWEERADLPEVREDWEQLTEQLARRWKGRLVVLVGHHPTVQLLTREYGPPPLPVPAHHFASALVMDPGGALGWTCAAAWPGRAG